MVSTAALDKDLHRDRPKHPCHTNRRIQAGEMDGCQSPRRRRLKLVETARDFVPGNPELEALANYISHQKQEAATNESVAAEGANERMPASHGGFVGVLQFDQLKRQCAAAVCRIELEDGFGEGTGFLVKDNLILTNYHVLESVIEGKRAPGNVVVRFDYRTDEDGVTVPAGRKCGLATDWKVAFGVNGEGAEELDFVLARLNESPGKDAVPNLPKTGRSYLKLVDRELEQAEPLVILQHPLTRPMEIALGSVRTIDAQTKRIVHDVNTEPGSSGSPCFDGQWKPVALHYYGSLKGNRAVQLGPILDQIRPMIEEQTV